MSLSDRRLYCARATVTDSYTLCPISGRASHTLWDTLHQTSEDMSCPGRRFLLWVKLLIIQILPKVKGVLDVIKSVRITYTRSKALQTVC